MSTFEKRGSTQHYLSKGGYHCISLCLLPFREPHDALGYAVSKAFDLTKA